MDDWTEKYRPKDLNQIIGNIKAIKILKNWAEEWEKVIPKKKALIISGKPGIGKTSCAYALANQFRWIPVELNTSDARNKSRIQKVATAGSINQSFSDNGSYTSTYYGGRKLIILDEADNLYERHIGSSDDIYNFSDKGGKKEIVNTIDSTKQPIILIVNDYYKLIKGTGKPLEKMCFHIKFFQPHPYQISSLLKTISKHEKIKFDPILIQDLSISCNGDIRSAIRDLQSLCIGKNEVYKNENTAIGYRDHEEGIFNVLSAIYSTVNISDIKKRLINLDIDPNMLLYWITENLPRTYQFPLDRANAYDSVSKADLFLSRTIKRNNYGLWAYAVDHMTYGVSLSKTHPVSIPRYQYPTWFKKKKSKMLEDETLFIKQLSNIHHCSIKKTKRKMYPIWKKLIENNAIDLDNILNNHSNLLNDKFTFIRKSINKKKKVETIINSKENMKKQKTLFFN